MNDDSDSEDELVGRSILLASLLCGEMGGRGAANEPADLGPLSPPTEKSAGAAFDFLRPILVVVRLPQIEREGREVKEGRPHALRKEGEEGRQSQKGATRPKMSRQFRICLWQFHTWVV